MIGLAGWFFHLVTSFDALTTDATKNNDDGHCFCWQYRLRGAVQSPGELLRKQVVYRPQYELQNPQSPMQVLRYCTIH